MAKHHITIAWLKSIGSPLSTKTDLIPSDGIDIEDFLSLRLPWGDLVWAASHLLNSRKLEEWRAGVVERALLREQDQGSWSGASAVVVILRRSAAGETISKAEIDAIKQYPHEIPDRLPARIATAHSLIPLVDGKTGDERKISEARATAKTAFWAMLATPLPRIEEEVAQQRADLLDLLNLVDDVNGTGKAKDTRR